MEIDAIMTLISNLAFPIAMCVWLMMMIQSMSKQHKEEMSKVVEALNNNTRTIDSLQQKIELFIRGGLN